MNKLPAITLAFWVMKICATTLGETGGDLLSMTLDVGYAYSSLILFSFFIVTLAAQLAATRYRPAIYWAVIVATSTAGTTMSDFMDRTLGLGYAAGSGILVAILLSIFAVWRLQGESLAVTEIRTRKVEVLYWIAILFSNTLGTALGDFLADSSGLGFAGGAFLIGGLLAAIVLAAYFTKVSKVFLFWAAFVLTRPFGATVGDLLTKPVAKGGFGVRYGRFVGDSRGRAGRARDLCDVCRGETGEAGACAENGLEAAGARGVSAAEPRKGRGRGGAARAGAAGPLARVAVSNQPRPVLPKPPAPRSLCAKSSTRLNLACTTGTITSCARRSNGFSANSVWPRFHVEIISSPW